MTDETEPRKLDIFYEKKTLGKGSLALKMKRADPAKKTLPEPFKNIFKRDLTKTVTPRPYTFLDPPADILDILHPEDNVEQIDKSLICPICGCVMNEPDVLPCGHVCCPKCLVANSERVCVLCGAVFSNDSVHVDSRLWAKLMDLRIHCVYEHEGCDWVGEYGQLKQHLKECSCKPMPCPNRQFGCEFVGSFEKPLSEHIHSCEHRLLGCMYCDAQIFAFERTEHQNTCPLFPVECEFCHKMMKRHEMDDHLFNECELVVIDCPLSKCTFRGNRSEVIKHINEDIESHMYLLLDRKQKKEDLLNVNEVSDNVVAKEEYEKRLFEFMKNFGIDINVTSSDRITTEVANINQNILTQPDKVFEALKKADDKIDEILFSFTHKEFAAYKDVVELVKYVKKFIQDNGEAVFNKVLEKSKKRLGSLTKCVNKYCLINSETEALRQSIELKQKELLSEITKTKKQDKKSTFDSVINLMLDEEVEGVKNIDKFIKEGMLETIKQITSLYIYNSIVNTSEEKVVYDSIREANANKILEVIGEKNQLKASITSSLGGKSYPDIRNNKVLNQSVSFTTIRKELIDSVKGLKDYMTDKAGGIIGCSTSVKTRSDLPKFEVDHASKIQQREDAFLESCNDYLSRLCSVDGVENVSLGEDYECDGEIASEPHVVDIGTVELASEFGSSEDSWDDYLKSIEGTFRGHETAEVSSEIESSEESSQQSVEHNELHIEENKQVIESESSSSISSSSSSKSGSHSRSDSGYYVEDNETGQLVQVSGSHNGDHSEHSEHNEEQQVLETSNSHESEELDSIEEEEHVKYEEERRSEHHEEEHEAKTSTQEKQPSVSYEVSHSHDNASESSSHETKEDEHIEDEPVDVDHSHSEHEIVEEKVPSERSLDVEPEEHHIDDENKEKEISDESTESVEKSVSSSSNSRPSTPPSLSSSSSSSSSTSHEADMEAEMGVEVIEKKVVDMAEVEEERHEPIAVVEVGHDTSSSSVVDEKPDSLHQEPAPPITVENMEVEEKVVEAVVEIEPEEQAKVEEIVQDLPPAEEVVVESESSEKIIAEDIEQPEVPQTVSSEESSSSTSSSSSSTSKNVEFENVVLEEEIIHDIVDEKHVSDHESSASSIPPSPEIPTSTSSSPVRDVLADLDQIPGVEVTVKGEEPSSQESSSMIDLDEIM